MAGGPEDVPLELAGADQLGAVDGGERAAEGHVHALGGVGRALLQRALRKERKEIK